MYIRADCLQEVGLFDANNFGLGYGEEVDFSLRASAKAWKNVAACDVYVQHKGGASFGSAVRLKEDAWQQLIHLYPTYAQEIAEFYDSDILAPIHLKIFAVLLRRSPVAEKYCT